MKLQIHMHIYALVYGTCIAALICMLCISTQQLLAMPGSGQETEVVEIVTEEVATPTTQMPTPMDTTAVQPASTPASMPGEQTPAPAVQTETIDPAAQPVQMAGPDIIDLEKTKPLVEQQNPKIMELFSQAEKLCNQIQDIVKNIESTKEQLSKTYNQVAEEKNLDLLLEKASLKKGILQQASSKK